MKTIAHLDPEIGYFVQQLLVIPVFLQFVGEPYAGHYFHEGY